jgi:hypothetical protein
MPVKVFFMEVFYMDKIVFSVAKRVIIKIAIKSVIKALMA